MPSTWRLSFKLGEQAASAEHGGGKAVLLCLFHYAVHVFIYLGVGCKISVDISGGFLSCDPDILSKRKRAYSVDYAEIDRLLRANALWE